MPPGRCSEILQFDYMVRRFLVRVSTDKQISNMPNDVQVSESRLVIFRLYIRLQCFDSLSSNIFTYTERFDPDLGSLFQRPDSANVRVGRISGTKLSCSCGRPTAFRIVPRARVAACASLEDGCLASRYGGCWRIENEAEASQSSGCHF